MRSVLTIIRNITLASAAIIASASASMAAPVNVNSSINSGNFVGTVTNVTGGSQSLTGGQINRGISATNTVSGNVVQSRVGDVVNTSSNTNSAIGAVVKTTKTGDYKAETGGKITSDAFVTQTGKATVGQTSANGVNVGSNQNSNIGFGNATVLGGNSKSTLGAVVIRGTASDNKVKVDVKQNSANLVNTGSSQNSNVVLEHNAAEDISSDATTGATINTQTVIGSDVTVNVNHSR